MGRRAWTEEEGACILYTWRSGRGRGKEEASRGFDMGMGIGQGVVEEGA